MNVTFAVHLTKTCVEYATSQLLKGISAMVLCQFVKTNESSNISKTTATNQCRRVPDLWRPGSVKIKRYYTKNGRLIPTAKRGKDQRFPEQLMDE